MRQAQPTETKARQWWLAKLAGERLPTHELPAELAEDLATWDHKEPEA